MHNNNNEPPTNSELNESLNALGYGLDMNNLRTW